MYDKSFEKGSVSGLKFKSNQDLIPINSIAKVPNYSEEEIENKKLERLLIESDFILIMN